MYLLIQVLINQLIQKIFPECLYLGASRIAIQIHSLTDMKGEILLDVCLRKLAGGR